MDNLTHLLEQYADDCSIFLESKDESLKKTFNHFVIFQKISGSKISVSKTRALWFGIGHGKMGTPTDCVMILLLTRTTSLNYMVYIFPTIEKIISMGKLNKLENFLIPLI